ncbi:MAG: Pr6Pr family membrane protein [Lachnospiraceae bacterium]|nr:Pr6Pr family membrane protein [Lachnospiraceae bacterium]
METDKERYKLRLLLEIGAFLAAFYNTFLSILWHGFRNFSYFTVLSNIWVMIMMAVSIFFIFTGRKRGKAFTVVKMLATNAITITFLIYLVILAPTDPRGFFGAYAKEAFSSLAAHVICPLCALFDYILYDEPVELKGFKKLIFTAFPLFYLFYSLLLGPVMGMRWREMRMPYNFLNFDAPCSWFGFRPDTLSSTTVGVGVAYIMVFLFLLFVGVGMLTLFIQKKVQKV